MSTTSTANSLDLRKFSAKGVELVRLADNLGYRLSQNAAGWVTCYSQVHPTKTVDLAPVRQMNARKERTLSQALVRYADPERVAAYEAELAAVETAARALATEADAEDVVAEEDELVVEVSVEPYRATYARTPKGRDYSYISSRTLEVTWSDGSKTYRCSEPGCDYERENHRSVANHGSSRHPQAPVPTTVRRLAVEGTTVHVNGVEVEGTPLKAADDPVIPHAGPVGAHASPTTPEYLERLSAEEQIAAIRTILDNGVTEHLRQQLAAAQEEVAALNEEVESLRAQVSRAAEEKAALRELLSD